MSKIMGIQAGIDVKRHSFGIYQAFEEIQAVLEKLSGSLSGGGGNYCRAFNNAAINIPNITLTPLGLNSTNYQNASIHNNAINTSRMTIPSDGIYHIYASIQWAAAVVGFRQLQVVLNGAIILASVDNQAAIAPVVAFTQDQVISTAGYFVAGDYLEIVVYQNSGGVLAVNRVVSSSPEVVLVSS